MKIVRITVSIADKQFFIDRPYDTVQNDFVNCDASMKWLQKTYADNKVIAVMKLTGGSNFVKKDENGKDVQEHDPFFGAIPALINLENIVYLSIDNVGVYEHDDKPKVNNDELKAEVISES